MLEKVISGGQTGCDRAALDAAIELGIPHGGWYPNGRKAEDGPIPAKYQLQEHPSPHYSDRTAQNVKDSDATLILSPHWRLSGGTKRTYQIAAYEFNSPVLVLDLSDVSLRDYHIRHVVEWFQRQDFRILNVAGPRESKCPGIYGEAKAFLLRLFRELRK